MEAFLDYIYIITDSSVTLFGLMFLASLANTVFPPVPAELGSVLAGYLAAEGHGTLPVIIGATTLGSTTGNVIVYYLARKYGMAVLKQKPLQAVFRNRLYSRSVVWFRQYGIGALLLAKFVPGMHFCAVIAAGALRYRAWKAIAGIFIGNAFTFAMLAVTGYFVESHWQKAYTALAGTSTLIVAAVIIAVFLFALARHQKKKKRAATDPSVKKGN